MVREFVFASKFGLTHEADLAVILLALPDLLTNILVSGGLSAALVPRFRQVSSEEGGKLFRTALLATLVCFSGIGIGFYAFPNLFFGIIAPGISISFGQLSDLMLFSVALAIPLSCLAGVCTAYLNSIDRYFVAGLGTLLVNLTIIVALLLVPNNDNQTLFRALAVGILIGTSVRLLSQLGRIPNATLWSTKLGGIKDKVLLRAFLAGVMASSINLLAPFTLRAFASYMESGSVASLNFAQKLVELPVGIIFSAIGIISLTHMSTAFASGGILSAREIAGRRLRTSIIVSVAITLGCFFFSDAIVSVVFERGKITAEEVLIISGIFKIMSLSIPFVAVTLVVIAYLNATLQTMLVLRVTFVCFLTVPILMLIGLSYQSLYLMVWSIVLFQILLAISLFVAAKLEFFTNTGASQPVVDVAFTKTLMISLIPLLLGIVVDQGSQFESVLIRTSILAICFLAGLYFARRYLEVK